ncbi:MAG: TonB-dependent receptor plug domain-containing protein, partial [Bacteroidota bacterium]
MNESDVCPPIGTPVYVLLVLLLAVSATPVLAQQITGTVTDGETGEALPGATVRAVGTQVGTITNARGRYTVDAPAGADSLAFSFVGYSTLTVAIDGRNLIDVELFPEIIEGEEVVVTALGIERERRTLGYAVQDLQAAELAELPEMNIVNALQGRLAGVQITQSGTGAGGSSRVTIRGDRFIGDFDNQPLVVVDGIPIRSGGSQPVGAFGGFDYGGGIGDLDPNEIESITVLRGANAAALYGSQAANGALLITTRRGTERTAASFSSTTTYGEPLVLPELQDVYGRGSGGTVCGQPICPEVDGAPEVLAGDLSWGARADGQPVRDWTGDIAPYSPQPDNVRDFFDRSFSTSNSVSFATGGPSSSARFSVTHLLSEGLLPDHRIERTNLSVRASSRLFESLDIDGLASYVYQDAFNRPSLTQNPDNVVFNFYYMPRTVRLQDLADFRTPDGQPRIWTDVVSFRNNPYWSVNLNTNEDQRQRLLGYLRFNYAFSEWLSAFVRGGLDVAEFRREVRVA